MWLKTNKQNYSVTIKESVGPGCLQIQRNNSSHHFSSTGQKHTVPWPMATSFQTLFSLHIMFTTVCPVFCLLNCQVSLAQRHLDNRDSITLTFLIISAEDTCLEMLLLCLFAVIVVVLIKVFSGFRDQDVEVLLQGHYLAHKRKTNEIQSIQFLHSKSIHQSCGNHSAGKVFALHA